jgi:hypothetical protein
VVGLAQSKDPESYASSSIATARVSHARQVKSNDPDTKGYHGPPGWKSGMRQPHPIKSLYQKTLKDPSDEPDKQKTI